MTSTSKAILSASLCVLSLTSNACGGSSLDHEIDLTQFQGQLAQHCAGDFSGQFAESSTCPYAGLAFDLTLAVAGSMACTESGMSEIVSCTHASDGAVPVSGVFTVAGVEQLDVGGSIGASYASFYTNGHPDFVCFPDPVLEPGLTSQVFNPDPHVLVQPDWGELRGFNWERKPNNDNCYLNIQTHLPPP